jgi:hypothetical protein
MEEISLGIGEEEDAPGASGGFDGFIESHAQGSQVVAGRFNVVNAQGEVTPAGNFVVLSAWIGIGSIDFEPEAAGKFEHEGGRREVKLSQYARAKDANVPILERNGAICGQTEVFGLKVHEQSLVANRQEESKLRAHFRGFT